MCGIGGIFMFEGKHVTTAMSEGVIEMFKKLDERGGHAFGYYSRETIGGRVTEELIKFPVTAEMFFSMMKQRISETMWFFGADTVLGHTRYATSGDPSDNKNNHPFVIGDYVCAHNGVYYGAPRTITPGEPETDSYYMFKHILMDVTKRDNITPSKELKLIKQGIEDFCDLADFAIWIYSKKTDTLYLARNTSRPLSYGFLKEGKEFLGIVFASEGRFIKHMGVEPTTLTADTIMQIQRDGSMRMESLDIPVYCTYSKSGSTSKRGYESYEYYYYTYTKSSKKDKDSKVVNPFHEEAFSKVAPEEILQALVKEGVDEETAKTIASYLKAIGLYWGAKNVKEVARNVIIFFGGNPFDVKKEYDVKTLISYKKPLKKVAKMVLNGLSFMRWITIGTEIVETIENVYGRNEGTLVYDALHNMLYNWFKVAIQKMLPLPEFMFWRWAYNIVFKDRYDYPTVRNLPTKEEMLSKITVLLDEVLHNTYSSYYY